MKHWLAVTFFINLSGLYASYLQNLQHASLITDKISKPLCLDSNVDYRDP